jgi:transcriptional regulator with XRE-family HTH domain
MKRESRLQKLRQDLNLTQEEFAQKLSVTNGLISAIEVGRRPLTDSKIKLICYTFGVNEQWLRTGEGEEFAPSREKLLEKQEFFRMLDKLYPETQQKIFDFIHEQLELQEFREKAGEKTAAAPVPAMPTDTDSVRESAPAYPERPRMERETQDDPAA